MTSVPPPSARSIRARRPRQDFIIAQCRGPHSASFPCLCRLGLDSARLLFLGTCHTNISRRAALRRRSFSLVLQVFARMESDYVQYISIVLCEVMLWSSSSCMLSCWNMINNLTSSSLQPLFAARMEKYYAMMCYIAPQGSKSLQPVRFC